MFGIDWGQLAVGLVFTAISLFFLTLDFKKCNRGHYSEKYGQKASSLWMLVATPFMLIAMIFIKNAFHR